MPNTEYDHWLELADLNLAAALKYRMQMLTNSILLEKDGSIAFSVGCPILHGHLNGVFRFKPGSNDEVLELANQFLQLLGYGFVIWIRDHADTRIEKILRDAGLAVASEPGSAGMIVENRLEQPSLTGDLKICKVSTSEDMADFEYVRKKAFDITSTREHALKPPADLSKPNISAYVMREGTKPLAAGMALVESSVAGLYYISTVPEARRRGLGELVTRVLTNAGFDLGARAVILQASQMGEGIYERLGYRTMTHYRWYYMIDPLEFS